MFFNHEKGSNKDSHLFNIKGPCQYQQKTLLQYTILGALLQYTILRSNSNNSESFPLLLTQLLSGAPNNKIAVATDNKMVILNHEIYLNDVCLVRQKRK